MSVVIEKIFLQILDMSIMASYCVLAVLALRWLFRKAPKRYSYLLWIIVAFRLICPLSIDSMFSIFNLDLVPDVVSEALLGAEIQSDQLPGPGSQNDQLTELEKRNDYLTEPENQNGHLSENDSMLNVGMGNQGNIGQGNGNSAGAQNDSQIAPNSADGASQTTGVNSGTMNQTGGVSQDTANQQTSSHVETNDQQTSGLPGTDNQPGDDYSQAVPGREAAASVRWSIIGSWAWAGGIVALGGFMMISWLRLKYQIRFAVKVKNGVYEADGIHSAFVLGVMKPKIYLPVGLTKEEQSWILLHENCHKWRKDYLIKMFASILTVIYWFNPLIWVAWNCFCRDMEMSCDEMALEGASQEMRKAYSRTLLSVASDRKVSWHLTPAFGENSVKSRIKHVLGFKKPAVWAGGVFAVVLVMMLVMFGTNGKADDSSEANGLGETVSAESNDGTQAGDGASEMDNAAPGVNGDNEGKVIGVGSGLSRDYRDVTYQSEALDYDFLYKISAMATNGEIVYLDGSEYSSVSGESMTHVRYHAVTSCKMDGSDMKTIYNYEEMIYGVDEVNRDNSEEVLYMEVDPEGNLILVMLYRISKESSYKLMKWDADGNELWSVPVSENGKAAASLACTDEHIYVGCEGRLYVYDHDGNQEQSIAVDIDGEVTVSEIYTTKDDQVYVEYYRWDSGIDGYAYLNSGIVRVDLESGTISEKLESAPANSFYGYSSLEAISGAEIGFDFVFWNDQSVFGWNIGDESRTELINFIDSDIDTTNLFSVDILGEDKFAASFGSSTSLDEILLLTKADPETLGDRQVIAVGGFSVNDLADAVRTFNQTNEEYYVKLMDYSIFEAEQAEEMLLLDIETGNAPDIYYLDNHVNNLSGWLTRGGELEDLSTWFENDPDLKAEDYLVNVFEAYGVDGAWYQLPIAFEINSYSAEVDGVGVETGWTIEAAKQLIESRADSDWCWVCQTKKSILKDGVQYIQFMDEASGDYTFDSEEFIELLTWANEFSDQEELDSTKRKNELAWPRLIRRFDDFRGLVGDTGESVLVGFPGAAGNGAYVDTDYGMQFSMSAQSGSKEGAWEFIKYFLSDDYQMAYADTNTYGFPVKVSALEAEAEKALSSDYYAASWIVPLTEEELDWCIEYMKTVTNADRFNYKVYAIIEEVAVNYFDGEITAEAAAEAIQRRVEGYLAQ